MKKSIKLSLLIIALLFIVGLVSILIKKQPKQTLFYSTTCPHCKVVDEYIIENNVKNFLVFDELEISQSASNSQLLIKRAASCKIPTNQVGVPFFYDGANCFMGDEDIIKYFESKK